MWYSSQKMTNTRMSSRAASAAAWCARSDRQRRIVVRRLARGFDQLDRVDRLLDPVLADLEVLLRQVGERLTLAVEHGDVDADLAGAAAEHRRLLRPAGRRGRRAVASAGGCAGGGCAGGGWAGGAAARRAAVTTAAANASAARDLFRSDLIGQTSRRPVRDRSSRTRAGRRTTGPCRKSTGWRARNPAASRYCAPSYCARAPTT